MTKNMKLLIPAVSVAALAMITTGCKGKWNGDEWVQSTDVAKQVVLAAIPQVPYQKEQHEALKAYFEKPEALLQLFQEEPKAAQGFNEYLSKQDFEVICAKTLLTARDWATAVGHCQKNRYFLCSESVRQYPEEIRNLRESLNAENQSRFEAAESCRAAVEDLDEG